MAETLKLTNPFPGLRPFKSSENYLFFGREDQSHELLRKLNSNRFVAVVGSSGSGKSSLVRAGLLPALHGGFMTRAGSHWRIAVFRPGHDPIGNLARSLNSPEVFGETKVGALDQATIIEITLRRGDLGLSEAMRQARLPAQENLLIVVDQFEELFRFKQVSESGLTSDDPGKFISLLLEAAKSEIHPIYVVLTMRSDFLGDCSQFRDLPEAMNEGQYLVPRMSRTQRDAAISGPIAVGGGEIAPRLVQQLLNDVGDNPDQLPILQHALMRTWNYWALHRNNGEPIDLEHYENIGKMKQAMSLHADEAYQKLPDKRSKKFAEVLFKTLSERGADNREIRRPTKLGQICAIAGASEKEMLGVIDIFRLQGRCFIMPPLGDALSEETLIDVSHESLIRNWELLKNWVEEEAQSAHIYGRLAETAVLYGEGKAGYWREPDLQIALYWQKQNKPNKAWGQLYHPGFDSAIEFLAKSKASHDAEISKIKAAEQRELHQAQELAKEQSKAAKRLRFAFVLSSILLLAAVIIVVAFMQRQTAVKEAESAQLEEQRQRQIASAAQDSVNIERERAELQASMADISDRERLIAEREKVKSDSTTLVFQSLYNEANRLEKIANSAAEAEKSAREVATAARDSALKSQRQVQAVALAIKSQRLQQQGSDTLSALLALESHRFNVLSDGQFSNEVYDALRRSLNSLVPNRGGPTILGELTSLITSMDYDPVRNIISIGDANGTLQLLGLRQSNLSGEVGQNHGIVIAAAFGPKGQKLASGSADFSIKIWNLMTEPKIPTILTGNESRLVCLEFNPDGSGLASGSIDGAVRYWDLQNSNQSTMLGKHEGSVLSIAFDKKGFQFVTGGADKRILLWNLQDKENPTVLDTLDSKPMSLTFSPNDDILAVGCEDGKIQLKWLQTNSVQILHGHQKRINSVAFNPSGEMLATGSLDKTIRLWNMDQLTTDPIILREQNSSVRSVAFTATGDTLIAGTFGKDILLYLTKTSELAELVRKQVSRNLTLEEWQEFVGEESGYPYTKHK